MSIVQNRVTEISPLYLGFPGFKALTLLLWFLRVTPGEGANERPDDIHGPVQLQPSTRETELFSTHTLPREGNQRRARQCCNQIPSTEQKGKGREGEKNNEKSTHSRKREKITLMENKAAARKKKTYGSFKSGNMEILKHRELVVYFVRRKSSCWFLNAAQLCQIQALKI